MGLSINGVPCTSIGMQVQDFPTFTFPEREYEVTHVPGRNGDIILDLGSYKNVNVKYYICFGNDFKEDYYKYIDKIAAWLYSGSGYLKIEDTYDTEHYRLGYCSNSLDFVNAMMMAGSGDLEFSCKPQRYLKTGDTSIELIPEEGIATYEFTNPTVFDSNPIITVMAASGTDGSFTISDDDGTILSVVNLPEGASGIVIDSYIQDAYWRTLNCNQNVTLYRGSFPKLKGGSGRLIFSGNISKVEVTPKWWTL